MTWLYKHKEVVDALERSYFDQTVLRQFNGIIPVEWALESDVLYWYEKHMLRLQIEAKRNWTDYEVLQDHIGVTDGFDDNLPIYSLLKFFEFLEITDAVKAAKCIKENLDVNVLRDHRYSIEETFRMLFNQLIHKYGQSKCELETVDINKDGTLSWTTRRPARLSFFDAIASLRAVIRELDIKTLLSYKSTIRVDNLPHSAMFLDLLEPAWQTKMLNTIRHQADGKRR